MVRDFLIQSCTVKQQNDGRILQFNDFTILPKLSLFIQNFVKYLSEVWAKKEFNFFYFLLLEI